MVAYGGLIHVLREKDFVDKDTGNYLDDDIENFSFDIGYITILKT